MTDREISPNGVSSPSRRKWVRRTLAMVVFGVLIVVTLGVGILLPYLLAGWFSSIPFLAATAVIAVMVGGWISAWVTAHILPLQHRTRVAQVATAVLAVLFTAALYVVVLRPTPEVQVTSFGESPIYWQLPTGSRIGYNEYDPPSGVSLKPEPILFLHGGPGLAVSPFERSFFKQFSADGYRVFLFDQAGSGRSAFLPPRQYTVSRFVEDIEAIRGQIGVEKLILVGHSWGSTLAASYLAKYPSHVAKVVFYSPGPVWNWRKSDFDFSRAAQAPFQSSLSPRLLAALSLAENRDNPIAGQRLVSQREAESLYLSFVAPQAYAQVCRGDVKDIPPYMVSIHFNPTFNPGFNPYVFDRLTDLLVNANLDPRPHMRGNGTPAIILFSECDYITWASSLEYRRTFSKAKVYYVPHAGHIIEFSQPDLMARIIRAFLLDESDVVPTYAGDADPRTVQR